MSALHDGPASPLFRPLPFKGNADLALLAEDGARAAALGMTAEMASALALAPTGQLHRLGHPL